MRKWNGRCVTEAWQTDARTDAPILHCYKRKSLFSSASVRLSVRLSVCHASGTHLPFHFRISFFLFFFFTYVFLLLFSSILWIFIRNLFGGYIWRELFLHQQPIFCEATQAKSASTLYHALLPVYGTHVVIIFRILYFLHSKIHILFCQHLNFRILFFKLGFHNPFPSILYVVCGGEVQSTEYVGFVSRVLAH